MFYWSLEECACWCVVEVGFLALSTVRWNLNDEQKHRRLNTLENLATGLVFIIVVVNIFITAFGVHQPNGSNWPRTLTGILLALCFHPLTLLPSLFKLVFSLLPLCAVCSYRHPCSQHVFGHSPPWPTNTLTSPGPQRNFHQKNKLKQNPTAFFLWLENFFLSNTAAGTERKQKTRGKQTIWQRGLVCTQHDVCS